MDTVEKILKELVSSNDEMLLSMIVSPDGLTMAYEGKVEDFDLVGALYIELELTCKKVMRQLEYGDLEEVFVRARSGFVQLMPITDKGVLASLSTPNINMDKMQIMTWRTVKRLSKVM